MPGAGQKTWRAFLSTTRCGTNAGPVHAIDRIGEGPWYDRLGRLLAINKTALNMTRRRAPIPPSSTTSRTRTASRWMSVRNEAGCAPGINLVEVGGPKASDRTVGSGGGYGGIYCFALTP